MSQPSARGAIPAAGRAIAALAIAALAAGCASASGPSSGAGSAPSASGSASSGPGQGSTGSGGTPSPVPTITATGHPVIPGTSQCANWPAHAPSETLPASFAPVAVLRCVTGTKQVPGKGMFLAGTLERADKNLGELVAALRRPSGHVRPGVACPMIAMLPQEIVLVAKDGSMIRPKIPVDGCGADQEQVIAALDALSWQAVSVRLYSLVPGGPNVSSPADPQPSDRVRGGGANS